MSPSPDTRTEQNKSRPGVALPLSRRHFSLMSIDMNTETVLILFSEEIITITNYYYIIFSIGQSISNWIHRREFTSFRTKRQLGLQEWLAKRLGPNMTRSNLQASVFLKNDMSLRLANDSLGIFSINPTIDGRICNGLDFLVCKHFSPT